MRCLENHGLCLFAQVGYVFAETLALGLDVGEFGYSRSDVSLGRLDFPFAAAMLVDLALRSSMEVDIFGG